MKKYIFITHSTKRVGGVQCYVAAKANYLESIGWQVFVCCPGWHSSKYPFPILSLSKYGKDGLITWLGIPPFMYPTFFVEKVIHRIERMVKYNLDDDITIESHADTYAQWGELFAEHLNARHYFYAMNEFYRGENLYYECKMDFFLYKFKRKEIISAPITLNRLFEGYFEVTKEDVPGIVLIDESPIQDVRCEKVEKIERLDYNICYIGRGTKSYVPSILSDVGRFASGHRDKQIQLITVSDLDCHKDLIISLKRDNSNLIINELGLLFPIPKNLYNKIDVVIAGAGSAKHSCEEGTMTIVADTETCKSNGLLGYDTFDPVYRDNNSVVTSFCDALEKVLVQGVYKDKRCSFPPKCGIEESTKHNFAICEKSEKEKVYYNKKQLLEGKVNILLIIRRYLSDYHPMLVSFIKQLTKK